MKDNTIKTEKETEVYLSNINIYADEYINTVLCVSPDSENYRKEVADSFVDMIFYIADHIQKPSNDDIELLDHMFSVFVRLCSKYHVLPTLEVFSFLVGINRSTFSDWMRGDYRTATAHSHTVKKWFDICKNCTLNRLHNQPGTTGPGGSCARHPAAVSAADRGQVQGRTGASGDGAAEAVNYHPKTSTRCGQNAVVSTKTAAFIQCA